MIAVGPLVAGSLVATSPSPRPGGWTTTAFDAPRAHFAEVMGYVPGASRERPGILLRPDGDCSTPTGGTMFGFDDACREHDLAYDVLRFQVAVGERVDVRDRWVADARFGMRMLERCAGRHATAAVGCLGAATVYATAVAFNSVRQGYGAPTEESGVQIAASTLALALLLGLPLAPSAGARAFRRKLRREELSLPCPAPSTRWAGSPGSLLAWSDLGREGRRLLNPAAVESLELATGGDVATLRVQCAAARRWARDTGTGMSSRAPGGRTCDCGRRSSRCPIQHEGR